MIQKIRLIVSGTRNDVFSSGRRSTYSEVQGVCVLKREANPVRLGLTVGLYVR